MKKFIGVLVLLSMSIIVMAQSDQRLKIKNPFYLTVGQSQSGLSAEMGSKFYFNRAFDNRVHFGLDVSYLSARTIGNRDFGMGLLESNLLAAGMKIGPNVAFRITKGIFVEANYRFNPEVVSTIVFEDYIIGQNHLIGMSVRVGPLMGRVECQIKSQQELHELFGSSDRPITVSVGLAF